MKNTNYLIAIVMMVLVAVTAVVLVFALRPDHDNTALIAIILGFVMQILIAVLGLMKSQETHVLVNSEMEKFRDQLKEAAIGKVEMARRDGKEAGREQEQQRVAASPAAPPVVVEQVVEHQTVERQSIKKGTE